MQENPIPFTDPCRALKFEVDECTIDGNPAVDGIPQEQDSGYCAFHDIVILRGFFGKKPDILGSV